MQSSLWKLLTAAGIIGIGTLIVLEVQNRLLVRKPVLSSVGLQTPGNEISVTPDASTEFDDALAANPSVEANDPSMFDQPGVGSGNPAPPADDTQYFGATEDHTLHKDELAEEGNPFSAAMNEPPEEAEVVADSSFAGDSIPLKSAEDESAQSSEFTEPVPALSSQSLIPESTVIPFPKEQGVSKPTVEQFPVAAVPAASREKSSEKTTIQFFSNSSGSNAGAASTGAGTASPAAASKAAAQPVLAAGVAAPPVSSAARTSAMAKPAVSAVVAAVADEKTVKTVQRVSASSADEPLMFVPEPVPDLSTPSFNRGDSVDDTPLMDPRSFEEDSVPLPSRPRVPATLPSTPRPAREETDVPFFGEDNGTGTPALMKTLRLCPSCRMIQS